MRFRRLRFMLAVGAAAAAFSAVRADAQAPVVTGTPQGGMALPGGPVNRFSTDTSFVNFEAISSRAVALSPNGERLFVTNTPADRLEIFAVTEQGLEPLEGVAVGLSPIAVAARSDTEVWVVNHLSDNVSVVDLSGPAPRVVRTLLVGDEPRDILFAGENRGRAFITAARRGQNHPADIRAEILRPSIGRGDVWVFDAANPGADLGGTPLTIVQLFGDKLGGLAATPDGRTVFANVFPSGNQTTIISDLTPCGPILPLTATCQRSRGTAFGTVPVFPDGTNQVPGGGGNTRRALIVKFDNERRQFRDVLGRDWSQIVPFTLPDQDVFSIDAAANPPVMRRAFAGVGTLNDGMAVNPRTGKVYVASIEAINTNRYLSLPGMGAAGVVNKGPSMNRMAAGTADPVTGKTLNGHLYESRVTVIDPASGSVQPRHLNKHINYEVVPSPAGVKERSVAEPKGLEFSADGETLWVTAMGSNQIVPFKTSELDSNAFTPTATGRIQLSGIGPTAMVIEEEGEGTRGFVYNRLSNSVAIVDLSARRETANINLLDPTPADIKEGRRFFYDATVASSNGEANCSVCHPQADKDELSWDIGTPQFPNRNNDNNQRLLPGANANSRVFFAGKGYLRVLSLRGIANHGPMFWRGDATSPQGGNDERANFQNFNVVFPALLGRQAELPAADFAKFTTFSLSVVPPPNPNRALNNQLTQRQRAAQEIYVNRQTVAVLRCNQCHRITNPERGLFGTSSLIVNDGGPVNFKVCKLRDVYDMIGMFGRTDGVAGTARTGPQIRGIGLTIDGSNGSPFDFSVGFRINPEENRMLSEFLVALQGDLSQIVGQQVTLRADSQADSLQRVGLMMERARVPFPSGAFPGGTECALFAKGVINGAPRGFVMLPDGRFQDDGNGQPMAAEALIALARQPGQELTFTCGAPGTAQRLGIDVDNDRTPDFLERRAGAPRQAEIVPLAEDASSSLVVKAQDWLSGLWQ